MVDAGRIYHRLPHWCRTYALTAYDASYAAVAEVEKAILITADEQLCLAAGNMAVRLKDITVSEDYEITWP